MGAIQLEAWSSGVMGIEMGFEGLRGPVSLTLAVELLRVDTLVHVMARAETDDPSFRELFPVVSTTVEAYPAGSVARAPLGEVGRRVRQSFFDQVSQLVRGQLEARRVADEGQADVLRLATGGDGAGGAGGVPSEGA